ncbi:hypothetical protein Syun_004187 [Stephania yunnanensis]|uniref:Uncharacterized protein n=1 Tax=Stephania yunnanensis TaxID=152371 RepID=A0AAP0Q180_9MAGN
MSDMGSLPFLSSSRVTCRHENQSLVGFAAVRVTVAPLSSLVRRAGTAGPAASPDFNRAAGAPSVPPSGLPMLVSVPCWSHTVLEGRTRVPPPWLGSSFLFFVCTVASTLVRVVRRACWPCRSLYGRLSFLRCVRAKMK